jgi:hypothetical protein
MNNSTFTSKKTNDDDTTIYTDGKERIAIRWLNHTVDDYLDKTTLIFGGSGSGKTTMIEEIMYVCKDYIPNYLVIAPKTSDIAYRKKLPDRCIKEDLTKKRLKQIWNRQVNLTQACSMANDPVILEKLFSRIVDREFEFVIKVMNKRAADRISIIEKSDLNFADKKSRITLMEGLKAKRIKRAYKEAIRKHKDRLQKMSGLSDKEMTALEYIDTSPRLMLIIDDCTEKFQGWMKFFRKGVEDNIFEKIFYKGRWNNITLVFAAHDDKPIDSELRKNARVIKYGTGQSLIASLGKTGNAFNKTEKKNGEAIAAKIYGGEDSGIKTHKKVCYLRDDPFPWRYTIANTYEDFKLGSNSLYDLVKKMPKTEEKLESNPFVKNIIKGKHR